MCARLKTNDGILSGELKLQNEEKERLKELVVTNPEEWESMFQKNQEHIQDCKEAINNLKNAIPK